LSVLVRADLPEDQLWPIMLQSYDDF